MSDLVEQMQADALEAQRFSRKHLVMELDFSEASVDLVEKNVDDVEYAIRGGKSEENIAMLTRIWGAYIGEALRKASDSEWVEIDKMTFLRSKNATTSPHEQVRQRIGKGSGQHLGDYFRRMKDEL